MLEIYKKIAKISNTAVPLVKDQAGLNYKYADLSQLLAILKPLMASEQLWVDIATQDTGDGSTQTAVCKVIDLESGAVLEHSTRCVAIPSTKWDAKSGQVVPMPNAVQQQGSIDTYIRRYMLIRLFNLETEDNDGVSTLAAGDMVADKSELVAAQEILTLLYRKHGVEESKARKFAERWKREREIRAELGRLSATGVPEEVKTILTSGISYTDALGKLKENAKTNKKTSKTTKKERK